MRLGLLGLAALSVISLATAPAFADGDDGPREHGFHPHISVQLNPNPGYGYNPGYVAPAPAYPAYGGGPVYAQPGYPPPGGRWQDPQFFSSRIDAQMEGIEGDLRDRIQSGVVSPRAMGEFQARRADIRGDVNAAGRDGVISPDERQHIREDVDSLRFIEQRFHSAQGGGPGAYGGWNGGWNR